jgi:hypothetical protein
MTGIHPAWRYLAGTEPRRMDAVPDPLLEDAIQALRRPLAYALLGGLVPGDLRPGLDELALSSLILARQKALMDRLRDSDLDVMAMKGFASALTLYEDPPARCIGDLDLLVRPTDLAPVIASLTDAGYRFAAEDTRFWGFQSEVSFLPMTSEDGLVDVDLHIAPDEGPLVDALSVEAVFERARTLEGGYKVPAPTDAALIALSNLAKERFEPYGLRTLVDLTRLAQAHVGEGATGVAVEWSRVAEVAEQVGLTPAWRLLAFLLNEIVGPELLGAEFVGTKLVGAKFRGAAGAEAKALHAFARKVAESFLTLRPVGSSAWDKILREALVCYDGPVVVSLWRRRLGGLIHRRSGLPEGLNGQTGNGLGSD